MPEHRSEFAWCVPTQAKLNDQCISGVPLCLSSKTAAGLLPGKTDQCLVETPTTLAGVAEAFDPLLLLTDPSKTLGMVPSVWDYG